ncbi:MAG: Zn-dependent hydrolase [Bacteroidia bacterium]|nr:Zn-dependent hydrolase [Bacteroidia bacterium]
MKKGLFLITLMLFLGVQGCKDNANHEKTIDDTEVSPMQAKLDKYATVRLTSDLSQLSENEKKMIPYLINAGKIMHDLFWYEAYGEPADLLANISDEATRKFVEINYGPWDRLDGNISFVEGIGEKPKGANYYPADMTKEEFEAANLPDKTSQYTFLRRDEAGALKTVWYHEEFAKQVDQAANLLDQASELAEDPGLKKYLSMRAEALRTDNYQASDFAWMDMKNNGIDVVIGPIETYEDALFGYKASHECYVLIKDKSWSQRLAKFAAFLPELQTGLPVSEAYKKEKPGTDADLNAYDVVFYAGDCNAGSKTIAINLPNDEEVQLKQGTRRLQLKNAMQAKFDQILLPIADELIDQEQRKYINFDAFFSNTMFHEVAHGLGIKNTINGKGTVRNALKEHASALEEGKADILGLYMITQLHKKGEIEGDLNGYYTTFMASIFRSIRFGASSAHGKANMIRFTFFKEKGAFTRDEATGTYKVNYEKMEEAMNALSELILTLQGNGDYDGVAALVAEKGVIQPQLQADLDRLADKGIPVDIVFEQGAEVLGL